MPETMHYRRSSQAYPNEYDWRRPLSRPRSHSSTEWPASRAGDGQFAQFKLDLLAREPKASAAAKVKFERLVAEWHDETDVYSSLLKVISHPAYLKIIAMGDVAIPMILQEMKSGPGHWFPAIEALTVDLRAMGEEPAKGSSTSSEARAAWVLWGESKGYL